MNWINHDDVLAQLRAVDFAVKPSDIGPCKRRRCKIEGKTQKGWFTLYSMPIDNGKQALTGAYGWWIGAEQFVYKIEINVSGKRARLSAEQREAEKARWAAEKREDEARVRARQERAAQQAGIWWRKLNDAGQSGYMAKKGFEAGELFGARVSPSGNLVVPVQDITAKIWGLEVIFPTKSHHGRDKTFTPAVLAKKGRFYQIGLAHRGGVVLLCEGFATGASLRKATGLPVVVAFDAGNLASVAIAIHKAHRKDIRILVCADDDYLTLVKTGNNPGIDSARIAAAAVNGEVVWPQFPDERPTDSKGPTDFNDLHVHPGGGLQAVRQQIEAAIAAAGWRLKSSPMRAESISQGGGESAGGRRQAAAILPLDDIVARFIPLDDGTGKYVWDTWTRKIASREQMLTLLPAGVRGDDIKRHPVWVERGAYYLDQVGFDPAGTDPAVKLNTWQGWPIQPKEGCCNALLSLLHYLCSQDEKGDDIFAWLLKWMAYPLQNPGAKMASAVIMHGPQGTGKSTVFQTLAKIYGDYATVLNQRGLEDRFNADWIDSKLFMLAEEVVTRAEMWHIKNELKELVTGEWVRVNPKNVAAYRQRNQVNVVYLSNEYQPLPIDNDDRRHLVIYTPPMLAQDEYDAVFLELERGGAAAFYHYLLNLDLGEFHPKKRPPMTEAKQALIDLSAPSETRFVKDWLHGEAGLPVCPALSQDIYTAYLRWCRANGESRPRPSNQFSGAIARLSGWEKRKVQVHETSSYAGDPATRWMIFPPDTVLQAAGHAQPAGHSQVRWHTDSRFLFHEALNDHQGGPKWANG